MRSRLARICGYGFGLLTMVIAIQGQVLAGVVPTAPEIDGSLISAGLGLRQCPELGEVEVTVVPASRSLLGKSLVRQHFKAQRANPSQIAARRHGHRTRVDSRRRLHALRGWLHRGDPGPSDLL